MRAQSNNLRKETMIPMMHHSIIFEWNVLLLSKCWHIQAIIFLKENNRCKWTTCENICLVKTSLFFYKISNIDYKTKYNHPDYLGQMDVNANSCIGYRNYLPIELCIQGATVFLFLLAKLDFMPVYCPLSTVAIGCYSTASSDAVHAEWLTHRATI